MLIIHLYLSDMWLGVDPPLRFNRYRSVRGQMTKMLALFACHIFQHLRTQVGRSGKYGPPHQNLF